MTRDSQRQKVYDAEAAAGVHATTSPAGLRILHREARPLRSSWGTNPSVEDAQRYVDHVTSSAWFLRRFGSMKITVKQKVYGTATAYFSTIMLPPWARNEGVILHEVAHCVAAHKIAGPRAMHGPEFVAVYLTLVRYAMGPKAYAALREQYRAHRVKVAMKAVPASRPLPPKPVPVAAQPPRPSESRDAAAVIRRAVKAGAFGPSGSKPRTHALATARELERWTP